MLQDGDTALHQAAAGGEVEIVNLLVKRGAAVDII
jgi:ankyrin repeat protein